MTDIQKKLRKWFRRRDWSVYDNNGGCGTVCLEKVALENPDYSFVFDYHEFSLHDKITIRVINPKYETICSIRVTKEELLKIVEVVTAAKLELETIRDMKGMK